MKRLIAILISVSMIWQQTGFAQVAPQMGVPQYLQGLISAEKFRPMHLRSVSFDSQNESIKVLLERGDEKKAKDKQIAETTTKLVKYFQIGIALPNSSFWVNLRPDASDQIIDPQLEKTDLGKVLLAADLQLKKNMAAMTDPNNPEGRQYWNKLYERAGVLFGDQEVEIPTYNRPWIVPGEIILGVDRNNTAYIYKATLKVMLESDVLAGSALSGQKALKGPEVSFSDPRLKELNDYSAELIKTLILPKLTRQINSSKSFADLRQVYYSLILSQWFKQTQKSLLSNKIDNSDLTGLTSVNPWSKETYFKDYQKSFQQGEYNKEEGVSGPNGITVYRYFSGGFDMPENLFDGGAAALPNVTILPATKAISGIQAVVSPTGQVSIAAVPEMVIPAVATQNNDGGKVDNLKFVTNKALVGGGAALTGFGVWAGQDLLNGLAASLSGSQAAAFTAATLALIAGGFAAYIVGSIGLGEKNRLARYTLMAGGFLTGGAIETALIYVYPKLALMSGYDAAAVTLFNVGFTAFWLGLATLGWKNIKSDSGNKDGGKTEAAIIHLKANLGANAVLGVSSAMLRLAAAAKGLPVYAYVARYLGNAAGRDNFSVTDYLKAIGVIFPTMNVMNGGAHGGWATDIQEWMIAPGFGEQLSFSARMEMAAKVVSALTSILNSQPELSAALGRQVSKEEMKNKFSTGSVGDEGGYTIKPQGNEEALKLLTAAIAKAKLTGHVRIAIDGASSEFFNEKSGKYVLNTEGKEITPQQWQERLAQWVNTYDIVSVEDFFAENDWQGMDQRLRR